MLRHICVLAGLAGAVSAQAVQNDRMSLVAARVILEELHGALTTEYATKELAEAAGNWDGESQQDRKDLMLPVMERLTKLVCDKYGFPHGYQEVMRTLYGVGQSHHDIDIGKGIAAIGEIASGKPQTGHEGRIPELDTISHAFLHKNDAERQMALANAESYQAGLGDDTFALGMAKLNVSAQIYVDVMRNVLTQGSSYVADQLIELVMSNTPADIPPEETTTRTNILDSFLTEFDRQDIMKKIHQRRAEESTDHSDDL